MLCLQEYYVFPSVAGSSFPAPSVPLRGSLASRLRARFSRRHCLAGTAGNPAPPGAGAGGEGVQTWPRRTARGNSAGRTISHHASTPRSGVDWGGGRGTDRRSRRVPRWPESHRSWPRFGPGQARARAGEWLRTRARVGTSHGGESQRPTPRRRAEGKTNATTQEAGHRERESAPPPKKKRAEGAGRTLDTTEQ